MYDEVEEKWWDRGVSCQLCGRLSGFRTIVANANGTHHNLVECRCGLRFFSPRLSWEWMKREICERDAGKQVAWNHFNTGVMVPKVETNALPPPRQKAIIQQHYRMIAERLMHHVSATPPRVLDVGSGIGYASKHFREIGWLAENSVAVELCPHAAGLAARRHSLDVRNCAIEDLDTAAEGVFDLIFGNDIIEHTYTPVDDLRTLGKMADSKTVLYLKTFDEAADEKVGRTMMCPPWHQFHFTQDTLLAALERTGWELIELVVKPEVQFDLVARRK
jgi:2-polyprenyl-3-methyl-5-hydroxy-6-metoxy-1,4-benzoquinol methylase